jgi:hypothetical protein
VKDIKFELHISIYAEPWLQHCNIDLCNYVRNGVVKQHKHMCARSRTQLCAGTAVASKRADAAGVQTMQM